MFPDCFAPVSELCPLLLYPLLQLANERGGSRADSPADAMPSEQFDMVCLGGGVAAGEATLLFLSSSPSSFPLETRQVRLCSLLQQSQSSLAEAATAMLGGSFGFGCRACTQAPSCCYLRTGCALPGTEPPGAFGTYSSICLHTLQHRVLQQQQQRQQPRQQ